MQQPRFRTGGLRQVVEMGMENKLKSINAYNHVDGGILVARCSADNNLLVLTLPSSAIGS